MRCTIFALLTATGLLAVLGGRAGAQEEPGARPIPETIMIRLCNKSSTPVFVTLIYRPDAERPKDWLVRGWWTVPSTQCIDATRSLYGYFYVHGENSNNAHWPGSDYKHEHAIDRCVEYPGPFSRVRTSGADKCRPELLRRFAPRVSKQPASVHTVDFNPLASAQ